VLFLSVPPSLLSPSPDAKKGDPAGDTCEGGGEGDEDEDEGVDDVDVDDDGGWRSRCACPS